MLVLLALGDRVKEYIATTLMQTFNDLSVVLNEIYVLAGEVISATEPIMKIISDNDEDLIGAVIDVSKRTINKSEAVKRLQNASSGMMADALKVQQEIDIFANAIATNLSLEDCECSFFKEVWFGDAYDGKTGIEALNELKSDLRSQYDDIDIEHLVRKSCDPKK